jgi:cytochrome c-L
VTGRRLVLALVVIVAGLSCSESAADPGDDEIGQLLQAKDADSPAVKQFKETGKNPYNADEQAVAAGFKLARANACTHCHGGDLSGLTGPNLTNGNWKYLRNGTDRGMFQTIYFGTGAGMAAWGKLGSLSEDEILKVMAFVRSKYRGTDITWR